MWSRQDCAKILVLAVLFLVAGLLLFPPPTHPAVKRPSPAYWIWKHTHAAHGSWVGAQCKRVPRQGWSCLLVIQRTKPNRLCWMVDLVAYRHAWRAIDYEALPREQCPVLHVHSSRGGRALKA